MLGLGYFRNAGLSALALPLLLCSCAQSAAPSAPKPAAVAQPAAMVPVATIPAKAEPFTPSLDAFAASPVPTGKTAQIFATGYVAWPAKEDEHGVELTSPDGRGLGVRIGVNDFCNAGDESTVIVTRSSGATVTLSTSGQAQKPFTDCHGVFRKHPEYAERFARTTYRPTPSDAPYGIGSQSHWRLVPYRSVAVKRGGQFPNGTVLYIKELAGKSVPTLSGAMVKHDGYVMVADIGNMTFEQIDFYKGATQNQTVPFTSDPKHPVDAVVVTDPAIIDALRSEHTCVCAPAAVSHD